MFALLSVSAFCPVLASTNTEPIKCRRKQKQFYQLCECAVCIAISQRCIIVCEGWWGDSDCGSVPCFVGCSDF